MDFIPATGTNVNPAIYETLEGQRRALHGYPFMEDACFEAFKNQKNYGTYVIPGLIRTETVNQYGEAEECPDMTPQGITAADDYILISAYCSEHKHNSVIYVLNKRSHLFVKVIVLPNRSHCGGLAYDPVCRNVWVATKNAEKGHGSISALKLSSLDAYNFTKARRPLSFDYVRELPQMKNNTFITYYGFEVYCGTYDQKKRQLNLYIYGVNPWTGWLDKNKMRSIHAKDFDFIGQYCQGIAISKEYILISASDGPRQESTISFFRQDKNYFASGKPERTIYLPPRLEQIYFDGSNTLLLLFESAAKVYRNQETEDIDRVLKCDVSLLRNSSRS